MMKSRLMILVCIGLVVTMTACDPKYPLRPLKAEYNPDPLPVGASADLKITYPDDGIEEIEWNGQYVEVVKGRDVLEVSGLAIKGIKEGTAVIKVGATAELVGKVPDTPPEKKYVTEIKVKVVDE